MEITLSPELAEQIDQEISSGRYRTRDELIEDALRRFLDYEGRGARRLEALRRIAREVDRAGLYERVLVPENE